MLLAFAALASACTAVEPHGRAELEKRIWQWPSLYYATDAISGRVFCAGKIYDQRQREFYRKYGNRVRAVLDRHVELHGRQNTIVAGGCRIFRPGVSEKQDRAKAEARFAKWLESAEKDLAVHSPHGD